VQRCARLSISALPKLGANLPERDRGKFSDAVRCQAIALINGFPAPTGGKGFDNPRSFPTMLVECGIEFRTRLIVSKTQFGANMIGEFAAKVVIKVSTGQAGEELTRQDAEAIST
jgi:hypothetical protein